MTSSVKAGRLAAENLDQIPGGAQDLRSRLREKRPVTDPSSAEPRGFQYNSDTEAT